MGQKWIKAEKNNNIATFNELSDGTYDNCTLMVSDAAGNRSNMISVGTFTIDTVPPVLSQISVQSDNINSSSMAKNGDNLTLGFSSSEPLDNSSTVTLLEKTLTPTAQGSSYRVTYTMQDNDNESEISFRAIAIDLAGNQTVFTVTSDNSSVKFESMPKDISRSRK